MARTATSLSQDEQDIIEAIENGSYFVENEIPSGTVNGSNVTFTLTTTPNPTDSLVVKVNGQDLTIGASNDYTLSGATITLATSPTTGSNVLADYRVDPT